MTKHQAPKDFDQQPRPACRVAELGMRFAAAYDDWNALDGKTEVPRSVEMMKELTMDALSDAAVFDDAVAPLGALFQLCIVVDIAERLSDMAAEKKANERAASADMARIKNALWSVRRFIERQFDVSAVAVGGEYAMSERLSPAAVVRDAIEAASSKRLVAAE